MGKDKLVQVIAYTYDLRLSTAERVADAVDDIVMAIKNEAYIIENQNNEI